MYHKKWSKQELSILRTATNTLEAVSRLKGRTPSAVSSKMWKLNNNYVVPTKKKGYNKMTTNNKTNTSKTLNLEVNGVNIKVTGSVRNIEATKDLIKIGL